MRKLLVSILALSATGLTWAHDNAAAGRFIRVANNGTDSGTCGSRAHPCRSISQAIAKAAAGDTILVGPGRYGDLNRNGVFGETGEERPRQETIIAPNRNEEQLDCMVCIDKALTLLSTDGAEATVVDGTSSDPNRIQNAMQIFATNVTIGARKKGFTLTGAAIGLHSIAGDLRVVGNIATANGAGFDLVPGGLPPVPTPVYSNGFDGPVLVSDNIATNNGAGFAAFAAEEANAVRFVNDVAINNTGTGFQLSSYAPHVVERSESTGNYIGIRGGEGPYRLERNIVNANSYIGLLHGQGRPNNPGSITVLRNSIVGNGFAGVSVDLVGVELSENNIYGNGTNGSNCGILHVRSAPHASNNYWGAPTGPGPDPADNVGNSEDPNPVCNGNDENGPPIFIDSFAAQPFVIRDNSRR